MNMTGGNVMGSNLQYQANLPLSDIDPQYLLSRSESQEDPGILRCSHTEITG